MDINKTLKNLFENNKSTVDKNTMMMDMCFKKVTFEKNIKDAILKFASTDAELEKKRNLTICLENEVIVLEKQKEILKCGVEDLLERIVGEEAETKNLQENFWTDINKFVADGNRYLEKVEIESRKKEIKTSNPEEDRKQRIEQLKAEGKLEATVSFESFQRRTINELQLLKEQLEN